VYITSIENTDDGYLVKYIYDNWVVLTDAIMDLRHRLDCNVRLQAVKGNEKAIDMLIRQRKKITA
jgi:hypothetical protein